MQKLAKTIEYLFYLFIFLLPWQTRWIWQYGHLGQLPNEYLTFSFYGTEIIFGLFLVLAAIYRLKKKDDQATILNLKNLDFYFLFLSFLVIAGLGLIWTGDRQTVLYYWIKFLEGIALVILIINFKFSYFQASAALVLAGLAQAILAIIQFMTQQVVASKWLGMANQLATNTGASVVESANFRWLRAFGSLPNPNILGGFLVASCLLVVVLLILSHHHWEKMFLWLAWPIILAGLFFTFSKSAFLALAIGFLFLAIFVFLSPDKSAKLILSELIFSALTILAILSFIYQDPVLTRLNGDSRTEIYSVQNRLALAEDAKTLIKQNWLLGLGLGNYTLAIYNLGPKDLGAYAYEPVHNVYLLVISELGVFGLLIFLAILIEALRRIYNFKIDQRFGLLAIFSKFDFIEIYSEYKEKFYWFLGYTAIFLAFLVIMVFDHYFWTLYFGIMLWWLCFGLWLKAASMVK